MENNRHISTSFSGVPQTTSEFLLNPSTYEDSIKSPGRNFRGTARAGDILLE